MQENKEKKLWYDKMVKALKNLQKKSQNKKNN